MELLLISNDGNTQLINMHRAPPDIRFPVCTPLGLNPDICTQLPISPPKLKLATFRRVSLTEPFIYEEISDAF